MKAGQPDFIAFAYGRWLEWRGNGGVATKSQAPPFFARNGEGRRAVGCVAAIELTTSMGLVFASLGTQSRRCVSGLNEQSGHRRFKKAINLTREQPL